jgi:hypothetical protein
MVVVVVVAVLAAGAVVGGGGSGEYAERAKRDANRQDNRDGGGACVETHPLDAGARHGAEKPFDLRALVLLQVLLEARHEGLVPDLHGVTAWSAAEAVAAAAITKSTETKTTEE